MRRTSGDLSAVFWLGYQNWCGHLGASLDRDFASPGLLGVRWDGPAGGTTFRDPVAEPRPGSRSRAYVSSAWGSRAGTTCSPQRHTECLSPPRPPGPNQPGTSGLWVHGMGKPPQYRVQRTPTDFCVPPREPFRPISTTGGLWGDGRASEAIATPTGGPPSRIRRSKASGGGAGCRAVATRGCGAGGGV